MHIGDKINFSSNEQYKSTSTSTKVVRAPSATVLSYYFHLLADICTRIFVWFGSSYPFFSIYSIRERNHGFPVKNQTLLMLMSLFIEKNLSTQIIVLYFWIFWPKIFQNKDKFEVNVNIRLYPRS